MKTLRPINIKQGKTTNSYCYFIHNSHILIHMCREGMIIVNNSGLTGDPTNAKVQ